MEKPVLEFGYLILDFDCPTVFVPILSLPWPALTPDQQVSQSSFLLRYLEVIKGLLD